MKFNLFVGGSGVCLVAALLSGCGNKQTSTPPTTEPSKVAESVTTNLPEAAPATTTVEQAATTAVTVTTQAVSQAAAAVSTQTTAVATQIQNLIDQAKTLVGVQKYQDALDTLKQLNNFQLTPEQQNTVDVLKGHIQKLMSYQPASNAVNSAGNPLGK
jgi:oligoendopeptidase F